jgi:hypothetical protein
MGDHCSRCADSLLSLSFKELDHLLRQWNEKNHEGGKRLNTENTSSVTTDMSRVTRWVC